MLSMKYMLIFLFVVSSYGQQGQQKASDVIINNEQVSVPLGNEVPTSSISKTTLPQAATTITKSQSATTPDVEIHSHSSTTDASPIFTPTETPKPNSTTSIPSTTPVNPTTPTPTNGTTTTTPPTTPTTTSKTTTEKPTTPPTNPTTVPTPTVTPTNKTTPQPNTSTTALPVTTSAPPNNRRFDGPSFIGGIVLASGLVAIGFIAFKFYKARTELNYHTL